MRRCSMCIMPETAKGIEFDEKGLCQLCGDIKKVVPKGKDALIREIGKYIQKNIDSQYNCVVPVSGGRDSAYALYYAKEILGLRPLAVHNDNDFETEIARENLDNMVEKLGVPLIRCSSDDHITKKIVAEKFKMNAPYGPGLIVDQTCEACKYGFESGSYNIARKYGIQVVIWGDSVEESTVSFHSLFDHKVPSRWERLFTKEVFNVLKYKYYFNRMKRQYGPDSPHGLKEIHFYDYIEWNREIMVKTIQDKLGWSKPKDASTSWRIDCSLIPLVDYLTFKAYGVSKIELGFSSMIRLGKMDREDALRQVEEIKGKMDIEELNCFLKDLDVSPACIKKVLR